MASGKESDGSTTRNRFFGPETKAQFTARLKEKGLWKDAMRRRESLKGEGKTGAEAWELIMVMPEFLPTEEDLAGLEVKKAETESSDGETPRGRTGGISKEKAGDLETLEFRKVAVWVFNSMNVNGLTIGEAPSAGAWSLLQWCRHSAKNQTAFYTKFLSLIPKPSAADEDGRADDGRELVATIDRLIEARSEAVRAGEPAA